MNKFFLGFVIGMITIEFYLGNFTNRVEVNIDKKIVKVLVITEYDTLVYGENNEK